MKTSKEDNKIIGLLAVIFTLLTILCVFAFERIDYNKNITELRIENDRVSRFEMCVNISNSSLLSGIYFYDKPYYCIWKDNNSISYENHEKCHYLVDKNYNHFCKGKE